VDLGGLVRESLKIVEHQLSLSNIKVIVEIEPDLPSVAGDHNLFEQVLMNLIWNAQAAMPKGGQLSVGVRRGTDRQVEFSVQDTGMGIPAENHEKIFTPFFTTKEVGKGTGLGLWVVRSIVEELKGTIQLESKPGKGTRFQIQLPMAE
jgi:signal transduction histidine kinase